MPEVVEPAEIHGEIGIQRQVIPIYSELDIVRALRPGEIVGDLIALLGAFHVGERLAAEKRKPGNIHSDIAASRVAGKAIEQATAGVLESELIDPVIPNRPGVLAEDTGVVIVLQRRPREGVLAKILRALRLHLDSSLITRTHTTTQRETVIGAEVVVQTD